MRLPDAQIRLLVLNTVEYYPFPNTLGRGYLLNCMNRKRMNINQWISLQERYAESLSVVAFNSLKYIAATIVVASCLTLSQTGQGKQSPNRIADEVDIGATLKMKYLLGGEGLHAIRESVR